MFNNIKMKLLIGGKSRNIHMRKDGSAYYKSRGENVDITHMFKKNGGGLKKQYIKGGTTKRFNTLKALCTEFYERIDSIYTILNEYKDNADSGGKGVRAAFNKLVDDILVKFINKKNKVQIALKDLAFKELVIKISRHTASVNDKDKDVPEYKNLTKAITDDLIPILNDSKIEEGLNNIKIQGKFINKKNTLIQQLRKIMETKASINAVKDPLPEIKKEEGGEEEAWGEEAWEEGGGEGDGEKEGDGEEEARGEGDGEREGDGEEDAGEEAAEDEARTPAEAAAALPAKKITDLNVLTNINALNSFPSDSAPLEQFCKAFFAVAQLLISVTNSLYTVPNAKIEITSQDKDTATTVIKKFNGLFSEVANAYSEEEEFYGIWGPNHDFPASLSQYEQYLVLDEHPEVSSDSENTTFIIKNGKSFTLSLLARMLINIGIISSLAMEEQDLQFIGLEQKKAICKNINALLNLPETETEVIVGGRAGGHRNKKVTDKPQRKFSGNRATEKGGGGKTEGSRKKETKGKDRNHASNN